MRKLGYLVIDKPVKFMKGYIGQVDDVSKVPQGIPFIIVGVNKAREYFGELSVYNRHPSKNAYWTFGRTERRSDMDKDIEKFTSDVIKSSTVDVNYHYVTFNGLGYTRIKRLIGTLSDKSKFKEAYLSGNIVYCLIGENDVIGISLNFLDYIGINRDKALSWLSSRMGSEVCDNTNAIAKSVRKNTYGREYVMPYLIERLS